MEMTKKEFDKWVNEYSRCASHRPNKYKIVSTSNSRGIIVVDCKTGKTGMSKCHPDDKFNYKIGVALAYARLKGHEIPTIKNSIRDEVEDFILDNIAPTCYLLIEDKHGMEKYNNNVHGREALITRIVKDIADFADGNIIKEYQTIRGLWEYCKKKKDFGSICKLYYLNVGGSYILIA